MKVKVKTEFWERIDTQKVNKILFFINIILITNTIILFANYLQTMAIINLIPITILTIANISYQKYEGTEKWKKQRKEQ